MSAMTTSALIQYYQNLLIAQYYLQPNAQAIISAFVGQAVANQLISSVRGGFNFPTGVGPAIDTAQGTQLDILATYRGLSRSVFGYSLTRLNFTMPNYGDSAANTDPGFSLYGVPVTWFFLNYSDANRPIYQMNDSELTRMIQFRAQRHSQSMTVAEVDTLVYSFFGVNAAVFENGPMNLTYLVLTSDPDSLFAIANYTESLPRPAGCTLGVVLSDSITGLFGFQLYSQAYNFTFVGFGIYGAPQSAAFLGN